VPVASQRKITPNVHTIRFGDSAVHTGLIAGEMILREVFLPFTLASHCQSLFWQNLLVIPHHLSHQGLIRTRETDGS
jgi:hypothetical protein